jgi:hypothetical protein
MARVDSKRRSGIHLTGEDSGWPVAVAEDTAGDGKEPWPVKNGTGLDDATLAQARGIDSDGSVRTIAADSGGSS